jgi:hypothetical protein
MKMYLVIFAIALPTVVMTLFVIRRMMMQHYYDLEDILLPLSICGLTVLIAVSLSLFWGRISPQLEFQQKLEQITKLQVTANELSSQASDVKGEVAGIKNQVEVINDKIDRVTTKQILDQLSAVDGRINDLSNQLASLQQIIDPSSASEILTVARMKNEIMARQDFENRVAQTINDKLKDADDRLKRTDDKLDNIQVWIWGSLLTFVAGLIGATLFLLQRFSQVVNSLAGGSETVPVSASSNPKSADQK